MVEVLRRYSRLPHLWRTAKSLDKILKAEPGPAREASQPSRIHRVAVRLAPEVLARLVIDYEAGIEVIELQERYGLSRGVVQRLIRGSGVPPHRHPLTPEQLSDVARLYESGLTIREVAAALGVPKTTVQDALGRNGVKMRVAARRHRE